MRYSLLLSSLFVPGIIIAQASAMDPAQGFTCRTHDHAEMEHFRTSDPQGWQEAVEARIALDERARQLGLEELRGGGEGYIIPVVFHIIHDNGPENISDAQVHDAIRVMNDDFNRMNPDWVTVRPDFVDLVADVGIEFRLAQLDPQGNCTNGITRTESDLTYEGDQAMTQLIQWPRNRYMNIWVGASANGAAGYTNYPWVFNNSPQNDGIVVKYDYVGSIGAGSPGRSRTLTHEVGHWLNLRHCWGNSNDPGLEENCSEDDDVEDTPLTIGWTACIVSGSSCGSPLDNVENYMEYSYCSKMFTTGQATRMLAALTSTIAQRNSLWQPGNLAMTGVFEEPQLCKVQLRASDREVCAGTTITFVDESYSNVQERTWSFPGGEPASSTEVAPLVTYTTPGVYPVSLTVSDGVLALSYEEPSYIVVVPDTGASWPLQESFEGLSELALPDWRVEDEDNNGTFELTSTAAFSGSRSMRLGNGAAQSGTVDALISSTYNVSDLGSMVIGFRYAFARRQPWNDDVLRMYVSTTCGATWSPRKTLRASLDLATAPDQGGVFVPDTDEWGIAEATSFGPTTFVPDLRIKFELTSNGGNYLYLDDININGVPLSTTVEEAVETNGIHLAPNPANERCLLYTGPGPLEPATLTLYDAVGKALHTRTGYLGGNGRVEFELNDHAPGLYWVVVHSTSGRSSHRLIIQR